MNSIYRHRNWIAFVAAIVQLSFAWLIASRPLIEPKKPVVRDEIVVVLAEPPPEAPPPPPEPPPPEPPPPTPPPPTPTPQRPNPPPSPVPSPQPVSEPTPQQPAPVPPSPAPPPDAPPPPPAPPPAPPVNVNLESQYVGQVRSYLNSTKRYPTGREASLQRPQGTTRVWFVLKRSGELVEADIQESSNSILLDKQALVTVRRASYPPFPSDAWPGELTHRFTVDLDFKPAN